LTTVNTTVSHAASASCGRYSTANASESEIGATAAGSRNDSPGGTPTPAGRNQLFSQRARSQAQNSTPPAIVSQRPSEPETTLPVSAVVRVAPVSLMAHLRPC